MKYEISENDKKELITYVQGQVCRASLYGRVGRYVDLDCLLRDDMSSSSTEIDSVTSLSTKSGIVFAHLESWNDAQCALLLPSLSGSLDFTEEESRKLSEKSLSLLVSSSSLSKSFSMSTDREISIESSGSNDAKQIPRRIDFFGKLSSRYHFRRENQNNNDGNEQKVCQVNSEGKQPSKLPQNSPKSGLFSSLFHFTQGLC
jgi:hypothetical protein